MNNYNEIVKQILQEENKIDFTKAATLEWEEIVARIALSVIDEYTEGTTEALSDEEWNQLIQQYGREQATDIAQWKMLTHIKPIDIIETDYGQRITKNILNDINIYIEQYFTQLKQAFATQLNLPQDMQNIDVQADTLF